MGHTIIPIRVCTFSEFLHFRQCPVYRLDSPCRGFCAPCFSLCSLCSLWQQLSAARTPAVVWTCLRCLPVETLLMAPTMSANSAAMDTSRNASTTRFRLCAALLKQTRTG
ncbi:hypothetical protein RRG08_016596 [Elysia crispata]|uniref:Uncharacterized protein n=1 Tax=Elysia crispata TaxID=231223 RepID=A0AAE1AHR6_9GAST|nr:hypothetical protein RRG08_016596 [Elysia crispata]